MATGNLGREGVGVSPLRGQNNVQGACDMGSFPHEFTAYRHVSDPAVRASFEADWGVTLQSEPGLRIPNMFEASLDGTFKGMYVQGEDFVQSDPNTHHVSAAMAAMECVIVQDLFLNETAKFAHVFLPGSSFLEKDGTFTNAERRVSRVRGISPLPGRGLAGYLAAVQRARLPHELRAPERDHGGDRAPDADIQDPDLREARPPRQHPVALHGGGARGHAHDARAPVRARQRQVLGHRVRAQQ
jgi:formate dehydrogenase major subunit